MKKIVKLAFLALSVVALNASDKKISSKYVFDIEMKNGNDVLFLVNKKTKERKNLLTREHISGGGFGCSFDTNVETDKKGNLYATYNCEISQQFQEDILENNAIYKFSKKGKLLKKIANTNAY